MFVVVPEVDVGRVLVERSLFSDSVRDLIPHCHCIWERFFIMLRTVVCPLVLSVVASCHVQAESVSASPLPPQLQVGLELFVSPQGHDAGPGSEAAPLATLRGARDRIRKLRRVESLPPGAVVVTLAAGRYPQEETFFLTAKDGGTEQSQVIYRAEPGAEVRISGGHDLLQFQTVDDRKVLQRIPKRARGQVLVTHELSTSGVDYGTLMPRSAQAPMYPAALELFFDDRPMTVSRWPNQGWARTAEFEGESASGAMRAAKPLPRRWSTAPDAWLHGFWGGDRQDQYVAIRAWDFETQTIATVDAIPSSENNRAGQRWRVLNLLEELDEPGEWYLDRQSGALYFWPPAPLAEHRAVVSKVPTVIGLYQTSYVTLQGLTVEAARVTGIEVRGGSHNRIAECHVRNIGNIGINVVGGSRHSVKACEVCHTGDGAIRVEGGDAASRISAGHEVTHSHLHDYSRWCYAYRPAVNVYGAGVCLAHNLIHDGSDGAIMLAGRDHLVEMNHIHHVCRETDDSGAIYIDQDGGVSGHVLRHNFVHDLGGEHSEFNAAFYLDSLTSGASVYGNVCHRTGRGVVLGPGSDNQIENNLFVDCEYGVQWDSRGLSSAGDAPGLGNILQHNIVSGGEWLAIDKKFSLDQATIADNWLDLELRFVDRAGGNLRLREESAMLARGFEAIPWDRIGPSSSAQAHP